MPRPPAIEDNGPRGEGTTSAAGVKRESAGTPAGIPAMIRSGMMQGVFSTPSAVDDFEVLSRGSDDLNAETAGSRGME